MGNPQDDILDILIAVPGILQDSVEFQYDRALETLKRQLVRLYESQRRWRIRSSDGKSPKKERWDKMFETFRGHNQFRSFLVASEKVLYNAALMLLLTLFNTIDPGAASSHISLCAAQAFMREGALPFPQPETATLPRHSADALSQAFDWVSRKHGCDKENVVLYLPSIGMAVAMLNPQFENPAISAMVRWSPVTAQVLLETDRNRFEPRWQTLNKPKLICSRIGDSEPYQVVVFVPNVPNEDCERACVDAE